MNVHYRVHNRPPHVPVVRQINPAQAISLSYFFDIDTPPPPKKHKLFTTIDVFLTKAHGVLCEVRTESLHIMTVEQLASGSAPRPPSFSCPSHPACPPRHRTHTRSHLVTPSQNHTPVFGSGVADHRKIFSRTRRRVQPTTRRNTF
jgi:hypothetical protein